jgi:hypothetical protein
MILYDEYDRRETRSEGYSFSRRPENVELRSRSLPVTALNHVINRCRCKRTYKIDFDVREFFSLVDWLATTSAVSFKKSRNQECSEVGRFITAV